MKKTHKTKERKSNSKERNQKLPPKKSKKRNYISNKRSTFTQNNSSKRKLLSSIKEMIKEVNNLKSDLNYDFLKAEKQSKIEKQNKKIKKDISILQKMEEQIANKLILKSTASQKERTPSRRSFREQFDELDCVRQLHKNKIDLI